MLPPLLRRSLLCLGLAYASLFPIFLSAQTTPPAAPTRLQPHEFRLELNRARFSSEQRSENVKFAGGGGRKDGKQITTEHWGYNLVFHNKSSHALTNLRIEYMLFVTIDDGKNDKKDKSRTESHRTAIEDVPVGGKSTVRTEAILAISETMDGDIYHRDGSDTKRTDKLTGIWLKLYQGDELVFEESNPVGLKTEKRWDPPGQADNREREAKRDQRKKDGKKGGKKNKEE